MISGGSLLRPRDWIVPRQGICAAFWCGVILILTSIVLLVTSKHKGRQYQSWGAVMLGCGCCLHLICILLCIHAYYVMSAMTRSMHNNDAELERFVQAPTPETIRSQMHYNLVSVSPVKHHISDIITNNSSSGKLQPPQPRVIGNSNNNCAPRTLTATDIPTTNDDDVNNVVKVVVDLTSTSPLGSSSSDRHTDSQTSSNSTTDSGSDDQRSTVVAVATGTLRSAIAGGRRRPMAAAASIPTPAEMSSVPADGTATPRHVVGSGVAVVPTTYPTLPTCGSNPYHIDHTCRPFPKKFPYDFSSLPVTKLSNRSDQATTTTTTESLPPPFVHQSPPSSTTSSLSRHCPNPAAGIAISRPFGPAGTVTVTPLTARRSKAPGSPGCGVPVEYGRRRAGGDGDATTSIARSLTVTESKATVYDNVLATLNV